MVARRDLNAPPGRQLADIVSGLRAEQAQSKTGAAGVTDYGETGDVRWTRPDAPEFTVSIRDIDGDLQDTQGRIEDAEQSLADSQVRLDEAEQQIQTTQGDLNTLETVTLPGAVSALEQADAAARQELTTLDGKLVTAQGELETAKGNIAQLGTDLATESDAREQLAQDVQGTFTELDTRLGTFATDEALAPIRKALTDAQNAVDAAQQVASEANTAANAASQAALEAAGIAASKGRVIIQETEPVGEDRNAANIWIKPIPDDPATEIEEKAITYVYLEASNEWVPTSSDELAQAAQNALDAREAARQAQQRADTAIANAATAQAAAQAAQQTADRATLDAREAHNEAVAAQAEADAAQDRINSGLNLVNDPSRTKSTDGWTANIGPAPVIEDRDMGHGVVPALKHQRTSHTTIFSDYFEIDPTQAYEFRLTFDKPEYNTNATSDFYFGMHAATSDRTYRPVDYVRTSDSVVSATGTNFYFWYRNGPFSGPTELIGYVLPIGVSDEVAGGLGNGIFNARLTAPDTAMMRLRFLNYANDDLDLPVWVSNVSVRAVSVQDLVRAKAAQQAAVDARARADAAYAEAESKASPAEVEAAANAAEQAAKTAAAADAKAKADQAKADALAGAATDAKSKADAAQAAAVAAASKDAAAKANKALQDALAALATARGEITAEIKASANGKNSITISTSAPSGRGVAIGDTWWRVDASGDIYGQWMWNGSWVPREIRSEVIANLDVHKLQVTGSAKMDEAVIDKLWVDGLAAKAITAQQVTVAPGNSFPDPGGLNVGTRNSVGGPQWSWNESGKYWRSNASAGATTQFNAYLNTTTGYDSGSLTPGETYRIAYDIWHNGSNASQRARAAVYYRRADGSTSFTADDDTADFTTPGAWLHVERSWTAPDDAVSGGFTFQLIYTPSNATEVRIRNPFIGVKAGAVSIKNGAVSADHVSAESVAGAVGKFVEAEVGNLKATKGTIGEAVIDKIWADGIAAKAITASRVVVAPGNLIPGMAEIGAGKRPDPDPFSGWSLSSSGYLYTTGNTTLNIEAPISVEAGRKYKLTFDVNGSVANTRYYVQVTGANADGSADGANPGVEGSTNTYIATNVLVGAANTWHAQEIEWTPASSGYAILRFYTNHGNGASTSTTHQRFRRLSLSPMAGATLIENGAITTPKLTVTSDMSAAIVKAMSVSTKKLVVTKEAILNHATLIGDTVVDNINVNGKLVGTNGVFTGTVDFANINVTGTQIVNKLGANSIDAGKISGGSFTGQTFTGGTFTGARINATNSSGQGAILLPDTTAGVGGLFFSGTGGTSGTEAAIFRGRSGTSLSSDISIRPATGGRAVLEGPSLMQGDVEVRGAIASNDVISARRVQPQEHFEIPGGGAYRNYGAFYQTGSLVYFQNLPSGSSSGNVVMDNNTRRMHQNFSSRRYKKNIVNWSPDPEAVLKLRPRQWQHDDPAWPDIIDERWHVGFVAEEVHELGLKGLVQYGGDGRGGWRPDSLNYDRFTAAQQVVLQKHEDEIIELRERIALLEAQIGTE